MFLKIKSLFSLTRPLNVLITFLVVIVGAVICIGQEYSLLKIILAGISAALIAGAGNVINDVIDLSSDKINHPKRPLPSGKITSPEAVIEYTLLTTVALLLSAFINIIALVIVSVTWVLLFFYSYRLKRIPLIGNLTVSFLTGLAFIYGGVAVNNAQSAIIPAFFAFMINLIRELIKDMQDVEGDSQLGIKTLPQKLGFGKTKIIITTLSALLIAATLIPFINRIYQIEFFVIVMVIVNPLLVYVIKKLFEDDSQQNLNKLSNILKLDMVFGLIAIFFGR